MTAWGDLTPEQKQRGREVRKRWFAENKEQWLEYRRQWGRANRDKERGYRLKHRFGITLEQYDEMLSDQNGVCAICEADNPKNKRENFCIDHDHKTGEIRGLLCSHCNAALGKFEDSVDLLNSAIAYLQRTRRAK